MKLLISFLLIASLSLVHCQQCNRNVDFDIYYLSLTWTPAFCSQNACKREIKNDAKFVIHGLWPNRNDRKPVGNCCTNEDFKKGIKELEPIKDKLATVWPSMRDNNPEGFWRYEYKKHGSCSLDAAKGVAKYFEKTLKIFEKLDLDNVMRKADFNPSDDIHRTYNSYKLEDALKKAYGAKPKIRCIRVSPKQAVLEQISFCFDKTFKIIDCQGNIQCAKEVIIPSGKADMSKLKISH